LAKGNFKKAPMEKEKPIAEAKAKIGDLTKPLVRAGLVPLGASSSAFPSSGGPPRSLPDVRGLSKRKVLAILDERKLTCQVVGSGIAQSQVPAPGSVIGKECKIIFGTD